MEEHNIIYEGQPIVSGLFNVKQFQSSFSKDLLDMEEDEELAQFPLDLSVDELIIISKQQKIQEEIKRELERREKDDRYDQSEQMRKRAETHLISMRVYFTEEIRKQNKEINYLASALQVSDSNNSLDKVKDDEVILSVAIYHPTKHYKLQEFLVLGSQPLSALKDRIYCLSDNFYSLLDRKSGYFFIENTFYNDLRSPDAIDYSQKIIQWVNEEERFTQPGLGIYSSKSMDHTLFRDLDIRIGTQYFYIHQGDCTHIISFTDLRMIHGLDNFSRSSYPLQTFQNKIRKKRCCICDIYPAKRMTLNDKVAPENPSFFCDNCFQPLHYSCDNQLLFGDFEVYPYHHD
eukprot:TRINITY_DN9035_c0_g1_i1.p1 TRINITY_DN9035_c0_g1~~TRINITY_DN9035_c0_g1_i1.p1  ORF type:complete len:346 (+),score=58.12 TRINITY_DN9035_c0_g1_i1:159-1196(+)